MDISNAYSQAIVISSIIMISYLFNYLSKKTNIPSVLMLIGLGVGIQQILVRSEINMDALVLEALELLGIIGLIMIVLEAALDLQLRKEKKSLLIR
ncbi:MAG: sodium:proton exchanger, partial [Bacteroidota bacterium]